MRGIFFIIVVIHGVSSSQHYSHLPFGQNHYGLHSLIVPLPCQADVLYEQLNYICVNNEIKCLPGWKNPHNYCRDPQCPEGCEDGRGICTKPNVCHCRAGYYGHACQNCVPLPGCLHGTCDRSYECNCAAGWKGIYCSKAICREGCHAEFGFCDRPGDCICHMGYQGHDCTECSLLPGCVHGHCERPLECICDDGWEGEFCNIPKCLEGCHPIFGSCHAPGECICRTGYQGVKCDECQPYPGCVHGTCDEPWTCHCKEGWTGITCAVPSSIVIGR